LCTCISPCTVGAVRGCRGCPTEALESSSCRHDMVLHCLPADDGVVVRRVAPIPGDFSDHLCMAHGFENMRKPRMRPQLTLPFTYRRRPHASPSQMTPSCSRTSKNMEHSIASKRWGHAECCHQSLPSLATFRLSWPHDEYSPTKNTNTNMSTNTTNTLNTQHSRNQIRG
jgi:hypothetical protein